MIKKISSLAIPAFLMVPVVTLAATADGVNRLIDQVQTVIHRLIPILISLGLLLFLWGVLRYLFAKDEVAQKEARSFMLWGIIALFVMVSVWGLVTILSETIFDRPYEIPPTIPRAPGTS
jgi:uncharacterized membrane protein YidH (DUF202 family)